MAGLLLAILVTLAPLAPTAPESSPDSQWEIGGFAPAASWRVDGGRAGFTEDGRWVKFGDKIYATKDFTLVGEVPGTLSADGTRSFRAPKSREKIGYFEVPSGKEIPLEIEGIDEWNRVLWDPQQKFLYVYDRMTG